MEFSFKRRSTVSCKVYNQTERRSRDPGGGGSGQDPVVYTGATDPPVISLLNLDILARGSWAGGALGSSGAAAGEMQ